MDNRPLLRKLESIEETQGKILFYIRTLAEQNVKTKGRIPEVLFNDQEVMFKLSWSKSTLKRRRAEGLLPFRKIKNKYYYREKDVYYLLFPDTSSS
ncbi:MAG: hypothetical protein Q8S11_04485 [Daejeonella sp.]|uniref:hypothetical protein n=1 Tax=Daejeonella sp. TaxID=2805397 RepID=UPI0027346EAD|nr:hypothetical protein [Daejeonella sp.]MDP3467564.1 hypothetical protein [Daejeonella sp.]